MLNTQLTERKPELGSDSGWAEAGCLLSIPGMILGALIGVGAWAHFGSPLGEVGIMVALPGGAILAFIGGGVLAVAVVAVGQTLRRTGRVTEFLSYGAWFLGSLAVPLLINLASAQLD